MNLCTLQRAALPAIATGLAVFAAAPGTAGTVTLSNDDTVTGTVTGNNDQNVTVEHADLGTLVIPAENVAGVELEESDPIYVAPPVPDFFWGWDKTLSAGITGSDGNTETVNLYAAFNTGYEDKNDRWDISADVFYSINEGVNTTNNFGASITKDWLLPEEDYFFWGRLAYENDRFTGFEQRISGFGGVGYQWIDTDEHDVVLRVGAGATYEGGIIEDLFGELFLKIEGTWTIDDRSSLTYYNTFLPSLDPFYEEFRNDTGVEYKVKVDRGSGLSLSVGFENQFNSNAAPGTEENDLQYYAALVYDFQ